jgi:hypothetical protein
MDSQGVNTEEFFLMNPGNRQPSTNIHQPSTINQQPATSNTKRIKPDMT